MTSTPFDGMHFCATHVDEKTLDSVKKCVKALGGHYRTNLTRDTRCLVVGERWTEKYNFSVLHRPDITLLEPEFVVKLFDRWLAGENVDMLRELETARMDVFTGLHVCISQVTDMNKKIYDNLVTNAGGRFTSTLTRDAHVLVSPLLSGRKTDFAKVARIPVVHPQWITDSIKHKYALDPANYLTELPEEKRGAPESRRTSAPLPQRQPSLRQNVLRVSKSSASLMWEKLAAPPAKRRAVGSIQQRPGSTIPELEGGPVQESSPGIFSGISFDFHGFDSRQLSVLRRTVSSHDGIVMANPDFTIVYSRGSLPPYQDTHQKFITEWAIERSLYKKACCLNDAWGAHYGLVKIPDFKDYEICVSGYSGVELLHLGRLIEMLGATYVETLTASRDILVANSPASKKCTYAKEWGIPVVSHDWLWECARTGAMAKVAPFLTSGQSGMRFPSRGEDQDEKENDIISEDSELKQESIMSREEEFDRALEPQVTYLDDDAQSKNEVLAAVGEETYESIPNDDNFTPTVVNVKRRSSRLS